MEFSVKLMWYIYYQWYNTGIVVYNWNISGLTCGIPVENSDKTWRYKQRYISGNQL